MRFKKNTKFQNILRKIYDKFIEKFVHKKCYKIITLNKYSKKRIIDSGIHKDKIEIIGLWKEDKYFTNIKEKYKKTLLKKNIISKEIFNKIKNKKVILSIGLISKERYILEMVELVKNFKEYTFIIGGIGDEQIITELKIKTKKYKNIIFLNFIKPNLIGEYTKISEIIYQVLNKNNLNNKYFMSTNKLFESIAGGCLFISTKNNEVEEINKKYSFCEFVNIKNFQRDINFILKKYEKNEKLLKIKQLNARKNFKEYNSQIARKNFKKLFFK
jgi:glycosyltransferase involved in cell wall biosynthesis